MEIRRMTEYESLKLDNQVCFSLYSAVNAITRAYQPYLKQLNLTYPQYIIMMALWERDAISITNLTEQVYFDSGTMTPILKRLAVKGLLTLVKLETDNRTKQVRLTSAGQYLKDAASSVQGNMLCQIGLPLETVLQLKAECDQIVGNLS